MLTLVDYFGANFVIYIMAMLEIIGVAWIYGLNNFCKDIEFMLDIKIGWYWRICWGFFIPVSLIGILIYALATSEPLEHKGEVFPDSAISKPEINPLICRLSSN
jgi:solute carrier family 6 amino acid transporter-like protein 5/7/9/14